MAPAHLPAIQALGLRLNTTKKSSSKPRPYYYVVGVAVHLSNLPLTLHPNKITSDNRNSDTFPIHNVSFRA